MNNQIICPNCSKVIANNPVIDSAANGEDNGSSFITCECGERITFWAITAQLRNHNKPASKIANWFHDFIKR